MLNSFIQDDNFEDLHDDDDVFAWEWRYSFHTHGGDASEMLVQMMCDWQQMYGAGAYPVRRDIAQFEMDANGEMTVFMLDDDEGMGDME